MSLACAVLAAGLAASIVAALAWRSSVRVQEREAFHEQATDASRTAELLLSRDAAFVQTLRVVLTLQPHMSASRFERWYAELQGKVQQVGGLGTTVVERVPASRLAAFRARRDADPAFRAFVGGTVTPAPPSGRAEYCLLSAGGTVTPYNRAIGELVQGDWCNPATPIGGYPAGRTSQALLTRAMTDSGQLGVYPVTALGVSTLFMEAAFYRSGAPIATRAERRAAVIGWVGSSFQITALIRQALSGKSISLELTHVNPGQGEEPIAQAGHVGALTHVTTMQIYGTWRVIARGSPVTTGLSANAQGLLLLLGGALVSILLAAQILVLTKSRERAVAMAELLRHQTLHDALTGLPNRVLALDRAEQMLARARRQQASVAALYIDLDGFKRVNDTFGHAAGDELLRVVAARLMTVIREGDTAARLSGDEFVILLESAAHEADHGLVIDRLLEVLCQPCEMTAMPGCQLSVTASVGVAVGVRASAEELIRDADLALYQAKANGRNRCVLFDSSMHGVSEHRGALDMDLADALGSSRTS